VAGTPSRGSLWAPVVLYLAFIFALSSVANTPTLPIAVSDKGLHGMLYLGLGALLMRALSRGFRLRVTVMMALLVTFCAALYGISDEFHQSFVPPRQVEALDVVADTIGAAAAAFTLYAWGIIRPRHGV
jgi:VanZ family protein